MTTTEFKLKYPQYKDLEGDELWNKMEDTLFEIGEVLYADPKQEKVFHEPIETEYGKITIEDSSTTRWLNSKGELVRIDEPKRLKPTYPTESHSFQIIDFGKKRLKQKK